VVGINTGVFVSCVTVPGSVVIVAVPDRLAVAPGKLVGLAIVAVSVGNSCAVSLATFSAVWVGGILVTCTLVAVGGLLVAVDSKLVAVGRCVLVGVSEGGGMVGTVWYCLAAHAIGFNTPKHNTSVSPRVPASISMGLLWL
jgi:hypothetical protein